MKKVTGEMVSCHPIEGLVKKNVVRCVRIQRKLQNMTELPDVNPICQNIFPGALSNLGDKNGVSSGIPQ